VARRIHVNGIVQGVGFRPFVYQLACQNHLKGNIANTPGGVSIFLQGPLKYIDQFLDDLKEKNPPLSLITHISTENETVRNYGEFTIQESRSGEEMATLIAPDVSVCNDCLKELFDPKDHRFHYPFINCTNCGPRYTIIDDIPYDRPKTSMKHFKMCSRCQTEYDNPINRRFHAQPNACAACGPHITLLNTEAKPLDSSDPITETSNFLKQGQIVAIKGLGGFHLAVDATNEIAVARLRRRKHREEKPFALMAYDLDHITRFAVVDPPDEVLLISPQKPIVIVKKREDHFIAASVSPNNNYFGVMLPYTPLHYLLLSQGFSALVMTSGNISEEPLCIDNQEAFERLGNIADYFLVHNRDIYLRSDDSIIRHTAGYTNFIRRSRGYVPVPIFLDQECEPVLACGAELKNTVCVIKGNQAFLSQHIGNLENIKTDAFFKMTIDHLKRILNTEPKIIACDLHPRYLSTQYAEELVGIQLIQIQHHHAHLVSCMAENRIQGPVIGLSFDGTGYGSDGHIWGGEVLIADLDQFKRVAHLNYVAMPGSSMTIKEPWRMAVSYLYHTFGESFRDLNLPVINAVSQAKMDVLVKMIQKGVNAPLTSSLGRLFDAVSAIIGQRFDVHFEGQAAMELEMMADGILDTSYDYEWVYEAGVYLILSQPIIEGIIRDMLSDKPKSHISAKFHTTLICLFADLCGKLRSETGHNRVALSGGVFQNVILLTHLKAQLEEKGFMVYAHQLVPSNDGGISLGQAVAAATLAKQGSI
jgi:hydrogenase maturation protein HypF